jgi:hypothetical protein
LQDIYPDYADKVNLYAVSYDTYQDMSVLNEHAQEVGWTWPVAYPLGTMLQDYHVVIHATKIAFDSNGVITYRAGPGEGTDEEFHEVFQKLAPSS